MFTFIFDIVKKFFMPTKKELIIEKKEVSCEASSEKTEIQKVKKQRRFKHNTATAASFLGYSSGYLSRMRRQGKGPKYYKQGNNVVYMESDLVAWAEKNLKVGKK